MGRSVRSYVCADLLTYVRKNTLLANDHYLDKLRVMGLEGGADQYADDGRFVNDMTIWPPV